LTDFLAANPRFAEIAAQAGFDDLVRVEGYAASLFLLLPVPLGLFAASRLAHAAADEVGGPLVLLLARPVRRIRWALAQTVVAAAAVLALALLSAGAFWLGTVVTGAGLHVLDAMAGTLNVVPVALLALGAALLGLGFSPQLVAPLGAVPVVGGFVIWVLAGTLDWPDWLGKLSPFAHLASVPARAPDVRTLLIMLAIAVVLGAVGVLRFDRRDLGG
jgi:ABC-2 type transport system permease protein